MIPRPKTEDAVRYNPGRWICNKAPEHCNGQFRVYGQDMPCPLRVKCYWGGRNTYQWTPGPKESGRYPALDVDADRRRVRGTLRAELLQVFAPEQRRSKRTPEQRERYNAAEREKRRKNRELQQAPIEMPKRPLLPCGEDCEGGCPYDGPCPYTDADIDALVATAKAEKRRAQDRAKHAREREREAVDPEYRAHRRELNKIRMKRYYETHKDVLRASARERYHKNKGKRKDV